ncbi:MAG: DUF1574 family protein [Gemmataceae bacterium]
MSGARRQLHRQRRREARQFLFWLVIGFALCELPLGWLVERTPQLRDPETAEKFADLEACRRARPDRPLVMAFGSSRTAMAFDAKYLTENSSGPEVLVYNMSIPGCGPMLQNIMLERVLARGIRPDLIFLEIMPIMFVTRRGQLAEEKLLNAARLRNDELWVCNLTLNKRWLSWKYYWHRCLPILEYQGELNYHFLGGRPHTFVEFGMRATPSTTTPECGQLMHTIAREQYAKYCACSELAMEPLQGVARFVERCRELKIPVRLMVMPEGSFFRNFYSAAAWQLQDRLIEVWRNDWNLEVIDARRWLPDEYFWDGHHVLRPGALAFTARFAREVLGPALQKPSELWAVKGE